MAPDTCDLKAHLTEVDGRTSRDGTELVRIATFCNVSPGFLYVVALGHKPASAELACRIEYATLGRVDRRLTLPSFPWDRPAEAEDAHAGEAA
ncbi:helix-turn-helix domain-containing protein [Lysobacter capsici]|uniref:helix-turn-helix domain-containing protein n=1 Tax=Lysobacter capsici TaxID=435897 RepID=UPI001C005558|nr:helix-turn-helix domain-containing protein [Lysobacter capsici]QWF19274.1 helix-turn-helix domain-containing protein [Lysobacter capsici]